MNGTVQRWVRLPRATADALADAAQLYTCHMSDIIQRALEEYLGRLLPDRVEIVRAKLP